MKAVLILSAILLTCSSANADVAANRWVLRAAIGEAISTNHGSALEGALIAEVRPDLWLGLETGVCKMQLSPVDVASNTIPLGGIGRPASLLDGITHGRVFFAGPVVRWGSTAYAVASYGIADVRGNSGPAAYLQGGSFGVGVGSTARFMPSAELRARYVSDAMPFAARKATVSGNALTFTVGVHVR